MSKPKNKNNHDRNKNFKSLNFDFGDDDIGNDGDIINKKNPIKDYDKKDNNSNENKKYEIDDIESNDDDFIKSDDSDPEDNIDLKEDKKYEIDDIESNDEDFIKSDDSDPEDNIDLKEDKKYEIDDIESNDEDFLKNDELNSENNDEDKYTSMSKSETNELMKENKVKLKKINKKHRKLKKFLRTILILILLLILGAVIGIVAIFKTDKWNISKEEFLSENGATVYDRDGNEIAHLTGNEINKKLKLDEMGKLPDAFISIEDERFYDNKYGIDFIRTSHAIVDYIVKRGNSNYGGSTITQQLVKITMKDDSRSGVNGIERKVREWSRAYQLEQMLTKEEILQRYLNRIFLGSSNGLEVTGVEAAANFYFNKSAADTSIAEAAFIAGINHAPNNYNPFEEKDRTETIKKRTKIVLDKMHSLNKISDDEYKQATDEVDAGLKFEKGSLSNGKSNLSFHTTAAINQISKELADKKDLSYDEARELLINSGYNIYTTLEQNVESDMETVFENPKYQVYGSQVSGQATTSKADREGQSAMVVIDPPTGYVVGIWGGLGEDLDTLGLNRGLSARQGGSAFKPLVTIAPGLENKVITASTLFYDVKTTFGGNYVVENDSSSYHGIENMRSILTHSCNVPEIKLLSIMGIDKSVDFLKKIGIDASESKAGLSMALGTVDITPLQSAAGYAMIANGGTYITPTFYTRVTDQSGKTIIEPNQEKTRVMSEQNAYIEASLLEGPIKNGTASAFKNYLGEMDVAGKTGTTEKAIDRWFCGFTPYYAAACWYGNDNNNASFYGTNPAATVWFNTMKLIHNNLEAKEFEEPDNIIEVSICKSTGKKATSKCSDTYTEIFASDNVPEDCEGHKAAKICSESGKLATEFCPEVTEKYFATGIDTEKNATWTPSLKSGVPSTYCTIHTAESKIAVPNVIGKSEDEATKILKNAGFSVSIKNAQDNKKGKGVVLSQSETESNKGAVISITVNTYNAPAKENKVSDTSSTNTISSTEPANTSKTENIAK